MDLSLSLYVPNPTPSSDLMLFNRHYNDILARPFRLAHAPHITLSLSDVISLERRYPFTDPHPDANPISKLPTKVEPNQQPVPTRARDSRVGRGAGWKHEEDRQLIELVRTVGEGKWSTIARKLGTRNGKQCRERYLNHLRPNIEKKKYWSNEEEEYMIEVHKQVGNKWAKMALGMPGRTDSSVKNHWNSTIRKLHSRSNSPVTPLSKYISANILRATGA